MHKTEHLTFRVGDLRGVDLEDWRTDDERATFAHIVATCADHVIVLERWSSPEMKRDEDVERARARFWAVFVLGPLLLGDELGSSRRRVELVDENIRVRLESPTGEVMVDTLPTDTGLNR